MSLNFKIFGQIFFLILEMSKLPDYFASSARQNVKWRQVKLIFLIELNLPYTT